MVSPTSLGSKAATGSRDDKPPNSHPVLIVQPHTSRRCASTTPPRAKGGVRSLLHSSQFTKHMKSGRARVVANKIFAGPWTAVFTEAPLGKRKLGAVSAS